MASVFTWAPAVRVTAAPNQVAGAWGADDRGQLGDDPPRAGSRPTTAQGLVGVVSVAAGGSHSLALVDPDGDGLGEVWAWGANDYGQLGDGTTTDRPTPVQARNADGSPLSDVRAISAGGKHTLAIMADRTVRAWGANHNGQLGDTTVCDTTTGTNCVKPNPVQVMSYQNRPNALLPSVGHQPVVLDKAVAVATGDEHSLALRIIPGSSPEDWSPWSWGANESGQLGDYTLESSPIAGLVGCSQSNYYRRTEGRDCTFGANNIVGIAAGGRHSLAVLWFLEPPPPGSPPQAQAVCCRNQVVAWGDNSDGQLGNGRTGGPPQPFPYNLQGLTDVLAVGAGGRHSLALIEGGIVGAWGDNSRGQLGTGTGDDSNVPREVQVKTPDGSFTRLTGAVAVSGGGTYTQGGHSLALVDQNGDGMSEVWAWGDNSKGQLGDPSVGPAGRNFAAPVPGLAGACSGRATFPPANFELSQPCDPRRSFTEGGECHSVAVLSSAVTGAPTDSAPCVPGASSEEPSEPAGGGTMVATTAPAGNLQLNPLCGDISLRGQSQPGYEGTYSVTDRRGGQHAYAGPLTVGVDVTVRESSAGSHGTPACNDPAGFQKTINSASLSSPAGDGDSVTCAYDPAASTYSRVAGRVLVRLIGTCTITQGGVVYTATTTETRRGRLVGDGTVTPPLAPVIVWDETYEYTTVCTSTTCDGPGPPGTGGEGLSRPPGDPDGPPNDDHPMAHTAGQSGSPARTGSPSSVSSRLADRSGPSRLPPLAASLLGNPGAHAGEPGEAGPGGAGPGGPSLGHLQPRLTEGGPAYDLDELGLSEDTETASGFPLWVVLLLIALMVAGLLFYTKRTGRLPFASPARRREGPLSSWRGMWANPITWLTGGRAGGSSRRGPRGAARGRTRPVRRPSLGSKQRR